jgi:GntR family transcriptional regulator / MocR family aminotransferase
MAKRTTQLALMLPPREPGTPVTRWLVAALRAAILAGRLRPGERLPATRDLAGQYALSRGTIVGAFEQLMSEGYLEARVGSGTRVARTLPEGLLEIARRARAPSPPARTRPRRISEYGLRVRRFPDLEGGPARAFRANRPALDLFPTALWAQLAARRLRRAPSDLLLGCAPLGYRPLQEAVATYLTTSRGVECAPEQVAIVSGMQEALDLVARMLLDPGDRVAIEDPGYIGAAFVFEAVGATVVPIATDGEGITLDRPALAGARLIYVTPAHQFPLGVGMSLARRLALLEWAHATGAAIFEDDYDSEYRYAGRPVPALQSFDQRGSVIYSGSFSKVLLASLRLGYLVVPPELVDKFAAARFLTDRHSSVLEQAVMCEFLIKGHFGRHIRRTRELYASRLMTLREALHSRLAGIIDLPNIEAGTHIPAWLKQGLRADDIAAAAAKKNIAAIPMRRFVLQTARPEGFLLGFAPYTPRQIRQGVDTLAAVIEGNIRKHRLTAAAA